MNWIKICVVFFICVWYCIHDSTAAQVRINEIGIEQSPQTIELVNISSQSADISGWYLDDSGGTTFYTVPNNTFIYPGSCTVITYDFNLNKSSPDSARLFDSTAEPSSLSANLIDIFSYKTSPGNGLSYSRMPDGETFWSSSNTSFGLWNSSLQNCTLHPTSSPTPTLNSTPISSSLPSVNEPTTTENPSPAFTYNSIYLSEVMAYPEKDNPEWIELYNANDYTVSLVDWYIDDIENKGSSPKLIYLEIPAKQFKTIEFTSSLFNNDKDSVRLLDSNKNVIDSFEYAFTTQGRTYGRISFLTDFICLQTPSKNEPNNVCSDLSAQITFPVSPLQISPSTDLQRPVAAHSLHKELRTPLLSATQKPTLFQEYSILGETDYNQLRSITKTQFYQSPFYLPFSYSLLTIFSVLIKMKNAV